MPPETVTVHSMDDLKKVLGTDDIVIVDRYDALGIPRPDPETVCLGQCEGTGYVPICKGEAEEPWRTLWLQAELKEPSKDDWHFVKCPVCNGTGKRPEVKA
jgi:hypothetical protein